jgi:ligand-binding SRPBCC domain-containing protein
LCNPTAQAGDAAGKPSEVVSDTYCSTSLQPPNRGVEQAGVVWKAQISEVGQLEAGMEGTVFSWQGLQIVKGGADSQVSSLQVAKWTSDTGMAEDFRWRHGHDFVMNEELRVATDVVEIRRNLENRVTQYGDHI